jgi:hypothetical protein
MSETETQHWLDKAASVRNETDGFGGLKKKHVKFLSRNEVEKRESELQHIESTLSLDNPAKKDLDQQLRDNLAKRRNYLRKELQESRPPDDLPGETKDALAKRLEVLNDKIAAGMLTEEVMWRNPTGAVDRNLKWHHATKFDNQERRNILVLLNPHDTSRSFRSVELLRKSQAYQGGAATFMANAQLPGNFAMTPQAKENWPLGEPKVDTPLKQAERREAEAMEMMEKAKALLAAVEEKNRQLDALVAGKTEKKRKLQQHAEAMRERAKLKREEAKEAKANERDFSAGHTG